MKNKFSMACIFLILVTITNSGFTANYPDKKVSNYEAVIGDFIDSFINSNYKKLDNVLSDNACVKIPRLEKVIIQNRSSLIDKMREDKGVKQNCTSSYEIIAKSDAIVIARVDFQYAAFKQQNFIVMEKNEDHEWKITQVCKMSQDNTPASTPQNVIAVN